MCYDKRSIIEKGNYDVIVVGGGIAGISAAVSAARNNLSVLLIEKNVNLGGLATLGLISWYEPLCDGEGKQMIGGICEEQIKLSVKYGFDNLPSKWGGSGEFPSSNERYSTYFSPTVFSLALDEYVLENGVKIRFDTLGVYPVMEGTHATGVICESVEGKEFFGAKVIIDASGTAVVMERAGVPTVVGNNFMSYIAHGYQVENVENLKETGNTCKFRKWIGVGSNMFGTGADKNMRELKGITADDVTSYVIYGKKGLLKRIKEYEKNSYDIMTLPEMAQFRTIRRIVGKTDFNAIDGEIFEDSIGSCGDFRPNGIGKHYQIPFGALYNEKFDNLIAAGRIISSPQGDGWEVARVIPVCALTGEAAGNAASLVVKNSVKVAEINIKELQKLQKNNGVLF